MATIGYKGALGGMAKDAIQGAGNALVGGLKGAVLREMPAVTAGMAFGKELNKRANAPKMKPGDTPPPTSSTSPAMGGFGASVSLVAGQNKSNVINIEQVRQLKQLNDAVANQSKMIGFQIADQKRKDQFAEEVANEQAFRDDELLKAIKNLGGGGGKGKGVADGSGAAGGLGLVGQAAVSAAGAAAGGFLKEGIKYIGAAIVSAIGIGFLAFKKQIAALVLSAALRFGSVGAMAGTAASAGLAISASAIAAIVAGIAALLFPTNAGAATGKHADTRTGRDAANDPKGAARRRAAEDATTPRVPSRKMAGDSAKWYESRESKEKIWDEKYSKTHDPVTGLLKDPKATTIYTPPAKGNVSSNFGEKRKDATGKDVTHQGVDIAMAVGTEVRPIAGGKVTKVVAGGSGAAGTYVQVTHPDGKISEYMHLKEALAKVGDEVTLASVIGKSGGAKGDKGAGSSTGPHLHLQLKTAAGMPIDPTSLPGLAGLTKGEKVSPADNTPKTTPSAGAEKKGDQPPKAEISNSESANYYKSLGVSGTGKGSTSNIGIDLVANKIADRMDAEASANTMGTGGVKPRAVGDKISDALRGLSAEQIAAMIPDFSRRYPGIQLAAGPGFNLGGGGDGGDWDGNDRIVTSRRVTPDGQGGYTGGFVPNLSLVANKPTPTANKPTGYDEDYLRSVIDGKHPRPMVSVEKAQELLNKMKGSGSATDTGPTKVIDKANLEVNKKQLAQQAKAQQQKAGSELKTREANDAIARQTKALKPLFRNNSDIIAETNKTFLQQFRSTATGIFTQAITKGLFPKGFGVSAAEAGRDDNFRGQQLQKIFGTDKVINDEVY